MFEVPVPKSRIARRAATPAPCKPSGPIGWTVRQIVRTPLHSARTFTRGVSSRLGEPGPAVVLNEPPRSLGARPARIRIRGRIRRSNPSLIPTEINKTSRRGDSVKTRIRLGGQTRVRVRAPDASWVLSTTRLAGGPDANQPSRKCVVSPYQPFVPWRGRRWGVKMGVGCPRRRRSLGFEAVYQPGAGARPYGSQTVP
jgi:hypothetical protein